jgi:hypothetical protein
MQTARLSRRPTVAAIAACVLFGALLCIDRSATAAPPPPVALPSATENSTDLDQILFVQTLPARAGKEAYALTWIPAPLQKYCLGKSQQACAAMDFCLRTTTPDIRMCKNLGSALTHMPAYPREMSPRRMLSVVLFPPSTMKGFDLLQKLSETMTRSSPQLFSLAARVKARVSLTRLPDDDDLRILEILAAAPFK